MKLELAPLRDEPKERTPYNIPSLMKGFTVSESEENLRLLFRAGYYRFSWASTSPRRQQTTLSTCPYIRVASSGRISFTDSRERHSAPYVEDKDLQEAVNALYQCEPWDPSGYHSEVVGQPTDTVKVSEYKTNETRGTNMNVLNQYRETRVANVTLINGVDLKEFTQTMYIAKIREINEQIKSYDDVKGSKAMDDIIKGYQNDLLFITAAFDTFAEATLS